MKINQNLDELSEEFDSLQEKNDELYKDITRLKDLLNSCSVSFEKLDKKIPIIKNDHPNQVSKKNSFTKEEKTFENFGKYLGKALTNNSEDKNFIINMGYKITHDLLNTHKKEIFSGISDIFSSFFGGARAGGGAIYGDKAFLVGERGPEIFRPTVRGNIERNRSSFSVNNKRDYKSSFQKNDRQIIKQLFSIME